MTNDQREGLLREWAKAILVDQVRAGFAPTHPKPWLAKTMTSLGRNSDVYIEQAVLGIRARATGGVVTGCREVRGSHGVTYEYDPTGTHTPPKWWSRDIAKKEKATCPPRARPA